MGNMIQNIVMMIIWRMSMNMNMNIPPQTARGQRSKNYKEKMRNNRSDDDISNTKHYKSQSHGVYKHEHHKNKQSKLHRTKRKHFNETAMDYMSAEQQLLYLFDYASSNVINRS